MAARSTFVTQLGLEHYEGLDRMGAGNEAGSSSQSTLLLQKKKAMQELQVELNRKKMEFELRMRKCQEKENELMQKHEKIRESVVRFEKFVKDNDGKRARALKKEKDEISSRREKEVQIAALQAQLEDFTVRKDRLLRVLGHLSVYQQYLEAVVEQSDGFTEMDDVLQRHSTLLATNADMRETLDGTNHAIEEQRVQLAAFVKEAENRRLVATSDVAKQQQMLEALRSENAALDAVVSARESHGMDKQRTLGEATMAIVNIYARARKPSHPAESSEDLLKLLEYICTRMQDFDFVMRSKRELERTLGGELRRGSTYTVANQAQIAAIIARLSNQG